MTADPKHSRLTPIALALAGLLLSAPLAPAEERSVPAASEKPANAAETASEKTKAKAEKLRRTNRAAWKALAPGLEFAAVEVVFEAEEADRIALYRFDPARFRLTQHHDYDAPTVSKWRERLGAVLVINAGFFLKADDKRGIKWGAPATPLLIDGARMGPKRYHAKHGVLLFGPRAADAPQVAFRDFGGKATRVRLRRFGYDNAVVSYPTLIDFDGKVRAGGTGARSKRTFIGIDKAGRVLIGVTRERSFSLPELGEYLRELPGLDAAYVLNLDGGVRSAIAASIGEHGYEDDNGYELPLVIAVVPR